MASSSSSSSSFSSSSSPMSSLPSSPSLTSSFLFEAPSPEPLNVLIIGAGIGGLTAALGLRRQGHTVTIFEQSRKANEYGAGISVPSHANAVLRRFGIRLEEHGAVRWDGTIEHDGDQLVKEMDLTEQRRMCKHPHHVVLRQDLHGALKKAALDPKGPGMPVRLITSSRMEWVDAVGGRVVLADGSVHQGDLVVGADGIKSRTRYAIPDNIGIEPHIHRMSSFRFLIPTQRLRDDPATRHYVDRPTFFRLFRKPGLLMVMYPAAGGEIMNFSCNYPSEMHPVEIQGWRGSGSKDALIRVYSELGPGVRAILNHVDDDGIGAWRFLDMPELPSWTFERVVLLGDAAHPFLPFMAQGAAMAIEDGAALAALFPLSPTRHSSFTPSSHLLPSLHSYFHHSSSSSSSSSNNNDNNNTLSSPLSPSSSPSLPRSYNRYEITARLSLYQHLRYDRATTVQRASRQAGRQSNTGDGGSKELMATLQRMVKDLENDDAWDLAERALERREREMMEGRVGKEKEKEKQGVEDKYGGKREGKGEVEVEVEVEVKATEVSIGAVTGTAT